MEKRIVTLTTGPHVVSLVDRPSSLFVDPASGSIFVDEGDGEGRMNGAVFAAANEPVFAVRHAEGPDWRLVLDYCGTGFEVGVLADETGLRDWAEGANTLLRRARGRVRAQSAGSNGASHEHQTPVAEPSGTPPT
jgi:hypothetical protein